MKLRTHNGSHRAEDEGTTLLRRLRKYILVFVGMTAAAAVGLAAAGTWTVIPNGHGNAYGKAKQAVNGVAVRTVDFGTLGNQPLPIGPSETGQLTLGMANDNAFRVSLDSVTVDAGAPITSVADPTCTAVQGTDFTVGATHPDIPDIGASSVNYGYTIDLTTTATFPICLQGQAFSVPITIVAHPYGA